MYAYYRYFNDVYMCMYVYSVLDNENICCKIT